MTTNNSKLDRLYRARLKCQLLTNVLTNLRPEIEGISGYHFDDLLSGVDSAVFDLKIRVDVAIDEYELGLQP